MNYYKNLLQSIIELIFPANCFGCGIEGVWLCEKCADLIPFFPNNICLWCNKKIEGKNMCSACQNSSQLLSITAVTSYQNPLFQDILHNLKYNFATSTINAFELLLIKYFKQNKTNLINNNSIIVPIPLHKKRLAERGFNQSELIGIQIAKIMNVEINTKILQRTKNTRSQMTLNKEDRLKNMKNSFTCPDSRQVIGKNILLVDDVLTTGATLNEAALALKAAGSSSVRAIVLAKGGEIVNLPRS
ncbi:MAG: phosphoribosyltransferase family protein [Patescibacteria group bacterium]|jgi:ComF family protein